MAEATPDALRKFQDLLKELFQFDCADLEFGIYRILNHKRDVIEQFIEQDLPERIKTSLSEGEAAEQAQDAAALEDVKARIRESFGDDAIDPDGVLQESYRGTPLGKEYLSLKDKIEASVVEGGIDVAIYNHLYTFFSRYYQDGDFISKRRYSRQHKYAIPYNGEEVYLYWANHDQYYVKTSEHFRDYAYTAGDVTVHFRLVDADVEQNNVKGDKRFFIPLAKDAAWDGDGNELTIPFEFRPLTGSEANKLGRSKQQDKILADAVEKIPKQVKAPAAVKALTDEKRKDANGRSVSLIEHHLRQYTRRNTSDFFIHKDLKGFLTRELDFYLKNEVLNLDELSASGEERAEGWFQMMQTVRSVGERIITFLAQIEDFQKMLWEKRKFVTDVQYCITVGNIDEKFYPEIAACDAQWEEWRDILGLRSGKSSKKRMQILRDQPSLPVDTVNLDGDLAAKLLSSFDDLEGSIDGVLIHSENYQALRFLAETYQNRIDCVYIDPPYNSKTSEILYKNSYKHSSWLSLMDSRLRVSCDLTKNDGSHIIAIDENEQEPLGRLLEERFPGHSKVCVAVVHNKKGIQGRHFSYCHEYAYFCLPEGLPEVKGQPVPEDEWTFDNLRKWGRESERSTAKNCFYPIYVKADKIIGFGDVCDEGYNPQTANLRGKTGVTEVYPVDSQGVERKWRYARDSVEGILALLKVHRTKSGEIQILKAKAERNLKTVWDDPRYIAGDYGTRWLTDLGIKVREDLYPKSIHTVEDSLFAVSERDAIALDYFAGSGTTGHAVLNLNRADGGSRKFILVEMGEYFDTVTLPRAKKIAYSPSWKNGLPLAPASEEDASKGPRILKYLRLETYEAALDGICLDELQSSLVFDDYGIQYMMEWESGSSQSRLNVAKLDRPFDYMLKGNSVDVAETFQYLLGLRTRTRKIYADDDRHYLVYRGEADSRDTVVIWRETEGWEKKDLERDREFVVEEGIIEGAEVVYANGDSFIPGAKALEPVFKTRMFAGVDS